MGIRKIVFLKAAVLFGLLHFAQQLVAGMGVEGKLVFSEAQASAGAEQYKAYCSACHGATLKGQMLVPGLAGDVFALRFGGKPAARIMKHLKRMPPMQPGSLSDENYANILAFLMQANGVKAGEVDLPAASGLLTTLLVPLDSGPTARTRLAVKGQSALLDNLSPVTTGMLNDPSPNDWLSWHRTNDSKGFTPLNQINKKNVDQLKKAWRLELPPGNNNPTPLVHDGVMFFYTFPDTVMALDATNGELLWRYHHEPEIAPSRKMGIALYEGLVIVPTSDMRMLALNAKTGELIWNHKIANDLKQYSGMERLELRAAPTIAGDKIVQGVVGSSVSKGSFIFALDAKTGEEVWRFYTIARPGEPGGNSWNDLPLERRSGGSVWIPGSYDPQLNLIYFGVAPTYDVQPLLHLVEKEGVSNEALYTNATIALNPDTGELKWHFQHLPNDYWDMDWAFERQIMELPVDGVMRKVVTNIGKQGIVETLDAATGEYLFSFDLGVQTTIASIDPVTGEKTLNPKTVPTNKEPYLVCPNSVGARSWPPMGYNPESGRLFVSLTEGCWIAGGEGYPLLGTGVNIVSTIHPNSKDGKMGLIQVVDMKNRKLSWKHRQQTPIVSSLLATGGGLVFSGDIVPSLKAFDEATGEILWQQVLDDTPSTGIVSYAVAGIQYLAVVVGQENNHVRDWKGLMQYYAKTEGWKLAPRPLGKGAAIWVFALEEDNPDLASAITPKP